MAVLSIAGAPHPENETFCETFTTMLNRIRAKEERSCDLIHGFPAAVILSMFIHRRESSST